jgi:hypothetical protein
MLTCAASLESHPDGSVGTKDTCRSGASRTEPTVAAKDTSAIGVARACCPDHEDSKSLKPEDQ